MTAQPQWPRFTDPRAEIGETRPLRLCGHEPLFFPSREVNPTENASLRSREEIKTWCDVRDSVQQGW